MRVNKYAAENSIYRLTQSEPFPPQRRRWDLLKLVKLQPTETHEVFGVEIEIEGRLWADALARLSMEFGFPLNPGWDHREGAEDYPIVATRDGSLDDGGSELITPPLTVEEHAVILPRILDAVKPYSVSTRCSTHVHMNVLNFSVGAMQAMTVLYMMLEAAIFRWIGEERKNVFDQPLVDSHENFYATDWWVANHDGLDIRRYCAYNVRGTLRRQRDALGGHAHPSGTVEFRHFPGLSIEDLPKFGTWLEFLRALRRAALRLGAQFDLELRHLTPLFEVSNTSQYRAVMHNAVGHEVLPILAACDEQALQQGVDAGVAAARHCLYKQPEDLRLHAESVLAQRLVGRKVAKKAKPGVMVLPEVQAEPDLVGADLIDEQDARERAMRAIEQHIDAMRHREAAEQVPQNAPGRGAQRAPGLRRR